MENKHDPVAHPSHYTNGSIETIDFIRDKLTEDEWSGYIKGNVLKYISRERHKGGLEDLRKAAWYLNEHLRLADKNSVSTADSTIPPNQKSITPSGMDVQSPMQSGPRYSECDNVPTTSEERLMERSVHAIENQNRLLGTLLTQNESLMELRKRELSCMSAGLGYRKPAGE